MTAEPCVLVRLEDEEDPVYARYAGRQVVRCDRAAPREMPAGSLLVPVEGDSAVRAALALEPSSLYGVFTEPRFRPYATPGAALPVLRVAR